jgi:hypothetical protein
VALSSTFFPVLLIGLCVLQGAIWDLRVVDVADNGPEVIVCF